MCISNDTSVKVYIYHRDERKVFRRIESVKAACMFLYCMLLALYWAKPEYISLCSHCQWYSTIQFTSMNFKNQTCHIPLITELYQE